LERRVRGQWADRAEIAAIQGEQRMGAQLGGVIGLNRPSRLQQVDRDGREEKPIASCLEQDEIDERCPVLTAKPGGGQLVHLGEY
jgi:hypothetical protein